MPLDYQRMMDLPPIVSRQDYTRRDTMLYALGIGVGIRAAADPAWLRYVYEDGLAALPTMAVVLAHPGFWLKDPKYDLDWRRVLHGEQSIRLHRPLPVAGSMRSETTIEAILDKGALKGAILYSVRRIFDEASGEPVADVRQSMFLRGDGGFGGRGGIAPVPHPVPTDRPCDIAGDVETRPEQALIYRLSGDDNPLHAAPESAAQAGFPRPILHGLASYGAAGASLVAALCGGDPGRFRRFDARFSSPVFPGETLRVEIWKEGPGRAAVQVRLAGRDALALSHGYVEYED